MRKPRNRPNAWHTIPPGRYFSRELAEMLGISQQAVINRFTAYGQNYRIPPEGFRREQIDGRTYLIVKE